MLGVAHVVQHKVPKPQGIHSLLFRVTPLGYFTRNQEFRWLIIYYPYTIVKYHATPCCIYHPTSPHAASMARDGAQSATATQSSRAIVKSDTCAHVLEIGS